MDWGAATTKLIVDLKADVPQGSVDTDSFSVHVVKNDPRLAEPFLEEGYRTVVDAYVSDADGTPVVGVGSFATLVMEIGPSISLGNALNYGEDPAAGRRFNNWTQNDYTITQEKAIGDVTGLVATEMDQYSRLLVDRFELAIASYEDEEYGLIELPYAHYRPALDDQSHSLIVWLHGGGEGGSDATGHSIVAFHLPQRTGRGRFGCAFRHFEVAARRSLSCPHWKWAHFHEKFTRLTWWEVHEL